MNPLVTLCILCSAFHDVYPLSIIPGGIASDADLERVRQSYVPQAEVYGGVGFVHRAYIQADRKLWASYLRDGDVYWAQVTVRKGEEVFVDRYGNMVRGRCGNRLCPQLPPHAKVFVLPAGEQPEVAWVLPPEAPPGFPAPDVLPAIESMAPLPYGAPAYPEQPLPGSIPPPINAPPVLTATYIPPVQITPSTPIPPAVSPVPEPGTWFLFAGGALLLLCWDMRRKPRSSPIQ